MNGAGVVCRGLMCRPGGFAITDRAMRFCRFPRGARLADIGCGLGATVRHVGRTYGVDICGVDCGGDMIARARTLSELEAPPRDDVFFDADAAHLPFAAEEMDGLLFECSMSKMDDPERVLAECRRVLKPGGRLIISDLYARGKEAQFLGLLGRVETRETIVNRLASRGFSSALFEDYSAFLKEMWGRMIMENGLCALCENLGTNAAGLRETRCGYCLIIAVKGAPFRTGGPQGVGALAKGVAD